MAESSRRNLPKVRIKRPTISSAEHDIEAAEPIPKDHDSTENVEDHGARQRIPYRDTSPSRLPRSRSVTPHNNIYHGSYAHSSRASTPQGGRNSPRTPPSASPRQSIYNIHLDELLPKTKDLELEDYGLEESRDGFFDASFLAPAAEKSEESASQKREKTPKESSSYRKTPLSGLLESTWLSLLGQVKSRASIKLMKSFLGVFIPYIICLIHPSRAWLGRYSYMLVLSAIVNHPGRSLGSQLDGLAMTCLGTIAGLGWGSLALYVSTSTKGAQRGYGGVLAAFLVLFTASVAFLRCLYMRFYQAVLSAGVAICYICLADVGTQVGWRKVFDYGIPWVLGQVICLIVAFTVFPSAGARSAGICFHDSLQVVREGVVFPRPDSSKLHNQLTLHFVKLSTVVRDFTIEFTASRFEGEDLRQLRNLIQALIRSILNVRPDTKLFDNAFDSDISRSDLNHIVRTRLSEPLKRLIEAMQASVESVDAVILKMAGLPLKRSMRGATRPLEQVLADLRVAKEAFDEADTLLLMREDIQTAYKYSQETIELFLFVHPVRQMANNVESLGEHVSQMQKSNPAWRLRAPSYPWHKSLNRSNAQVRHDRGGLTAGFYFRTKAHLDRTIGDLLGRAYVPISQQQHDHRHIPQESQTQEHGPRTSKFRHGLWQILHRLQGFESRFAFKVTLVTTLLSIPAWLLQSRTWWTQNESWWVVVTAWIMMHPRVGGTFLDLFARCFCTILGAVWGGLAYRAGNGNPYVMAVFAAIYLLPMLYRFTQSSHPRSGFIGCVSFVVISLDIYTVKEESEISRMAWTRGLAFVIGTIAAVVVNWVLWPFIARHELRKSISTMMIHSAMLYRGIIATYVYYTDGEEPGAADIQRSEMLEGRLREGFVRMRQLLDLSSHELRLRGPFKPTPYAALISSLEAFFNHLVQVRQSSLYFRPGLLTPDPATIQSLTNPRRDAVAVVLTNLYILSCALRADQKVPRYLPGAAAARKKLLDQMEGVEAEYAARVRAEEVQMEAERNVNDGTGAGRGGERALKGEGASRRRRWEDVYHYAYSAALTDIVEELQTLERWTREICGNVEWPL